jgi:hypothetical protein
MTDTSTVTVKPCPFCGSTNVKTAYVRDGRKAHCFDCFASGRPEFHGPKDMPSADERAIAAWNTRADEDDELNAIADERADGPFIPIKGNAL